MHTYLQKLKFELEHARIKLSNCVFSFHISQNLAVQKHGFLIQRFFLIKIEKSKKDFESKIMNVRQIM